MRLVDKTAIVTGGASGIGASTVRRFVQEGARVIVADRDAAGADALATELGDATWAIACDVRDEGQIRAVAPDQGGRRVRSRALGTRRRAGQQRWL